MRRIQSVEALRGLAALSVSWFHFTNGALLEPGWLKASGAYGWLGIDVFFVISGFVIPYSMHRAGYRAPRDIPRFLAKRLVRLQPPYLAAVALCVILLYAAAATPGFQGSARQVGVAQVLLHVIYLPQAFGYPMLNPVFWTLGVEVQYYLLVAILFPLLVHPSRGARLALLAALCLTGALVTADAWVFHFTAHFAFGSLAFQRTVGFESHRRFVATLALLALLALTGLPPVRVAAGIAAALPIAFFDLPHTAPFAWLGSISYSYYLVHVPVGGRVVNLGARVAHSLPAQVLVLVAAVAVSLAAAWAMSIVVERPAQRWSARLRYGDRAS